MMRVNIGCGQTPTFGWRNFDNSVTVRLSKLPVMSAVLRWLGVLNQAQYQFTKFARQHKIEYGNAVRKLPLKTGSCDVVYSSHMLEHLDRSEAGLFLREAHRLLCPNGILRIAVPDISRQVAQYNACGDADAFMEASCLCVSRPKGLAQRLRLLLVGTRHHQWMYDGKSLSRLLAKHGFVQPEIMPVGMTGISDAGPLNLQERCTKSVYVEARKPAKPA